MAAKTLEQLIANLTYEIQYYDEMLAEWAKQFASDPQYALEWSSQTFMYAARRSVYREVLAGASKEGATLESVRAFALGQALNAARTVQSNSSQPSNIAKEHVRAEWARLVSGFDAPLGA